MQNPTICHDCFLSLGPVLKTFSVDKIKCLFLYYYNEKVQEILYQFKGCKDYELRSVFLEYYANYLNFKFNGYYIVPAPSTENSDKERGFNHVEEMFNCLNLKKCDCLVKTEHYNQSEQSYKDRKKIKNYIRLKENTNLKNKKLLLVDDICTTGSSLRAAIELIKTCEPKKIEILVVAKRDFTKEEAKEMSNFINVLK